MLLLPGLVSCSQGEGPAPDGATVPPTVGNDGGVQAVQADGIWIFQHDPDGGSDALHSGTPVIVDGCLRVGEAVVVWHVDRIDDAEGAIAAARAGDPEALLIGGGGMSLAEGGDLGRFPAPIRQLCPTAEVWFQSP